MRAGARRLIWNVSRTAYVDALIFTVAVLVFLGWCVAMTGAPKLAAAYAGRSKSAKLVGWFALRRNYWNPYARGLFRVSADATGLTLMPAVPPYWRAIFVPWDQIWISNIDGWLAPRLRLGFLKCPDVVYIVSATLISKAQEVTHQKLPPQCFV